MRPQKIHSSGLALALCICWGLSVTPVSTTAQCNGTTQTVTYSTTVTGSGSDTYSLTLPQYDPSGYTLIGATIDAYLTTTSSVSFQNTNATSASFRPKIGRGDEIDFNGNYLADGSANYNLPLTNLGAAGSPTDQTTYPPTTVFNNYHILSYSLDNSDPMLTDMEGNGNLSLTYTSTTYINAVTLGVSASATAFDNIKVNVTYTFCNPSTLSSNIVTFTAVRRDPQTVAIGWLTANEQAGRKYEVEVSKDGTDYSSFSSRYSDPVNSDANYSDSYAILAGSTGKLWFRLKQTEVNGASSYSVIRVVNLDGGAPAASGFSIFPNPPTDFINVQFPETGANWQVDILAADGMLVQRNYFHNATIGVVNFTRKLAAGTYFVRATNIQSAKTYAASMSIH